MHIIEAKHIVKQYENHLALDDVSMSIPQGKIYGLLGPNGAGKTSLIRIINQITMADKGEILFDGRPIGRKDIERIGYLPEERGLYKKMKVGEQILYLARLKGLDSKEAKKRTEEWFERMEVGNWWKKKIEELSKGMQQKIQFITTVIHNPKLLIFDEPFSGFDPVNAAILKEQILLMKENGATLVLSTHNMESVEELCDEITLINRSKVVLQGEVTEIKQKYKESVYCITLSGNQPLANNDSLFEVVSTVQQKGNMALEIKKQAGVTNAELLTAIAVNNEIISFEEKLPSMNEIFIKLVKS